MQNNFANNLKHLRNQNGLTQEELAKILHKDYSTIGKWENGSRSPIMEDAIKLADYFHVSLQTLIGDDIIYNDSNLEDEILFNKYKELSVEDKELIKSIIDTRKKQIDKELGDEWLLNFFK